MSEISLARISGGKCRCQRALIQAHYVRVWPGGQTRCPGYPAAPPALASRPGARIEVLTITGTFYPGVPMVSKLSHSRKLAFDRQDNACYYCGLPMWLGSPPGPVLLRCTAEHLRPRSEGGGDSPSNIVAACLHCNRTRHKRKQPPDPEHYRTEVRRRLKRGGWVPAAVLTWLDQYAKEK
jgi:5-methylcytosine-specific restriction endonuclease McrA